MQSARFSFRFLRKAVALVTAAFVAACAGAGQSGVLMPSGNGATSTFGGAGNTVVRIYVPAGAQINAPVSRSNPQPSPTPGVISPGAGLAMPTAPVVAPTQPPPSQPQPPGSQLLAIDVSGPTTITQTVSVGPNSSGCAAAPGGSTCQLALSLPAGTYTGTVGSAAIAFTVAANSNNSLNLTLGGVPSQMVVVPASFMSAVNAQGGIDLYGAGKHALLVEMLDANQNVMIGESGVSFTMSQAGGSLPVAVTQATSTAANLFNVTVGAGASASSAMLRLTANSIGPNSPCAQSGAVCNGTVRVDVRQILAVANSGANSVALYVNGQSLPVAAIQNAVMSPQALIFDAAGDLFVANQSGGIAVYAPPYNQAPLSITNGVNHPQALALDARGNLFVANGNGSNTVTVYAPPYGSAPSAVISSNVNDPVSIVLDSNADLFVVNAAANTVSEYAPPYASAATTISKGLNTPNSVALDAHGNLFVANLNSTPNSVVEYVPPFSNASAPVATITNGVNEQGAITVASANLFVPNEGANTVTEYTAPYTGAPTTIVGGQSQPTALAIDAFGNLYVANYGNNTVTEYGTPYAPGTWTTIATGIAAPVALALSPATNGGPMLLP
jgi:hypothetical protein